MNSQFGPRGRVASAADDADRAVLVLVAAGQLDALQELYDKYRVMAYSIALRITADASLAEDVVQDAFLGAWRNAARYAEGKGSVKTWLLSIVHHRAVDAVRRRRPTSELPEPETTPPASLTLPDIWPEEAAVREHLATCTQPHTEFAELGGVVPYLIESADLELVEPPASLRDRIMAAAAADLEERTRGVAPAAPAAPATPPTTSERTLP